MDNYEKAKAELIHAAHDRKRIGYAPSINGCEQHGPMVDDGGGSVSRFSLYVAMAMDYRPAATPFYGKSIVNMLAEEAEARRPTRLTRLVTALRLAYQ